MKPTNKPMKRLSLYLFLILFTLQTPSQADDIRDFQIEGMSLEDSLLDYMSEESINENVSFVYEDKKFTISMYKKSTEIYDQGVAITYKSNDKTYKIHGVQGRVNTGNNIEDCYRKQDEVEKEISSMFDKVKKENWGILDFNYKKDEPSDRSTFKGIAFDFNKGDSITITCYYYYNDPPHALKISMTSNEFTEYLRTGK